MWPNVSACWDGFADLWSTADVAVPAAANALNASANGLRLHSAVSGCPLPGVLRPRPRPLAAATAAAAVLAFVLISCPGLALAFAHRHLLHNIAASGALVCWQLWIMFLILVDNERAQIYCLQLQNRSVDINNYNNNKGQCKCNCNCNVGVLQSADCNKAWPWQLHKHRATKRPTPKRMQFHCNRTTERDGWLCKEREG